MELEFLREDFKQAYKNDPVLKKEVDDMFEYLENYFLDPKSKSDDNSVQTCITDYLSKFLGDEKINLPGFAHFIIANDSERERLNYIIQDQMKEDMSGPNITKALNFTSVLWLSQNVANNLENFIKNTFMKVFYNSIEPKISNYHQNLLFNKQITEHNQIEDNKKMFIYNLDSDRSFSLNSYLYDKSIFKILDTKTAMQLISEIKSELIKIQNDEYQTNVSQIIDDVIENQYVKNPNNLTLQKGSEELEKAFIQQVKENCIKNGIELNEYQKLSDNQKQENKFVNTRVNNHHYSIK